MAEEPISWWRQNALPMLSLFSSVGTLLCCALPALLVTIGAGATLASLVHEVPWLVSLSRYKAWTFSIAGVLLLLAGIMRYRSRNAPCPIDPLQAKACARLRKVSAWMYGISVAIYAVGFFFAFIAVHIFY